MRSKPRRIEDILCAGGECMDAAETTMLLELSLQFLREAKEKRAACELLATPARMRLPVRAQRMLDLAGDHAAPGDDAATAAPRIVRPPSPQQRLIRSRPPAAARRARR